MMKLKRIIAASLAAFLVLGAVPFFKTETIEQVYADNSQDDRDYVIVSLGDSYSAGEGAEPFFGQNQSWDDKLKDWDFLAHRSQEAWSGYLTLKKADGSLVKMNEHRGENWFFVASSGAVTKDIKDWQEKEYDRDGYTGTEDLAPQIDVFSQDGSIHYGKKFDVVPADKKIDYVTITIGGNDVGFSNVVTEAYKFAFNDTNDLRALINTAWQHFYHPYVTKYGNEKDAIRDRIKQTYRDIDQALKDRGSDDAAIIVAGYPTLIDENGSLGGNIIIDALGFTPEEAHIINDNVKKFNHEIACVVEECKAEGIKICFVDVEEAFAGNEAYTSGGFLNKVCIVKKDQDLKGGPSAYSIHPSKKKGSNPRKEPAEDGISAYALCVQAKLDYLENGGAAEEWPELTRSEEREVVLVLDTSGSMSGEPLQQTQIAACNFVEKVLEQDASVGIVSYSSNAYRRANFTRNAEGLKETINSLYATGGTNIDEGLQRADEMLASSTAKKKIIVLMSDGMVNEGREGEELYSFADEIKAKDVYIYTLGFFTELSQSEKAEAQYVMDRIASQGNHYEVDNTENLTAFFDDIADQLNGQRYIYYEINSPVDVQIRYDGEILDSSENNQNNRTNFGTIIYIESEDGGDVYYEEDSGDDSPNGVDNRVKIVRLKEGANYKVHMTSRVDGMLNFRIGLMDEDGNYTDFRNFNNIKIANNSQIETTANNSDVTEIKIDEDGDGKYDVKYRAGKNGMAEKIDNTGIMKTTYIILVVGVVIAAAVRVIILFTKDPVIKVE